MVYRTTVAAPVFSLRREIYRLFEDTFGANSPLGAAWTPAVNVREDDKDLTFSVELPGVKPDQVEITSDNGVLTIRGARAAAAAWSRWREMASTTHPPWRKPTWASRWVPAPTLPCTAR